MLPERGLGDPAIPLPRTTPTTGRSIQRGRRRFLPRGPDRGNLMEPGTEGREDQDQRWRNKLGDAWGLAALTAGFGALMAGGCAMASLDAFRAGMAVQAWALMINAGVFALMFPGAVLLLEMNRLRGFAGIGLAIGVAGGSVIGAWAFQHFMAGDPAMGTMTAVMAAAVTLGMPAMAALFWKVTQ